jgi:pyrroloquinoline quinone biosynthesis protein B
MRLRVLGTAAGGGVPQWNCDCSGCAAARPDPDRQRTHASVAVQVDDEQWLVVNAGPDIGLQINACPELWPGPGRRSPVSGVLLTDAELDHTLGLFRLREARELAVRAAPPVLAALRQGLRLDAVLGAYSGLTWSALTEQPVRIGTLELSSVPLGPKRPRYAAGEPADDSWVSAMRITEPGTGKVLLYAPCVATWSDRLETAVQEADCVFLDGTFWDDDEPVRSGFATRTATAMGHLPIRETAARLAKSSASLRFYTHLNNTNPLVHPDAPEHRELAGLGIGVAVEKAVIDL